MPYTNGQWYPGDETGPGAGPAPQAGTRAYLEWLRAGAPQQALTDATTRTAQVAAQQAGPQGAANTQILQNQAARSAPSYIDPLEQQRFDEQRRSSSSMEALQRLGIDTSASTSANSLAEQAREAKASESLAEAKFGQTKADRAAALAALDSVWGGGSIKGQGPVDPGATTPEGPYGPGNPPFGTSPGMLPAPGSDSYDTAAEDAAYTGARQRVGAETAASLKGLREVMSGRGIGGSGIEGKNIRSTFKTGLEDLAGVNAGLAAGKANRAFDWQKTMAPIREQGRQFDVSAAARTKEFAAQQLQAQQMAKIQALLGLYGVQY